MGLSMCLRGQASRVIRGWRVGQAWGALPTPTLDTMSAIQSCASSRGTACRYVRGRHDGLGGFYDAVKMADVFILSLHTQSFERL